MSNNTTNKISQESDTKQDIHQAEQSSPDAASITDTLAANIAHEFNTSLTIIANAERIIRKTLTHFSKACKKLGIEVIKAYSPQAKGRVER